MLEFQAAFDAFVERELPKMMARPIDTALLMGPTKQFYGRGSAHVSDV